MGDSISSQFEGATVTRRSFLQRSALVAATGTFGAGSLFGCQPQSAETDMASTGTEVKLDEPQSDGEVIWHQCAGCGGQCPLQFHVQDGAITYVETDTHGEGALEDIQNRACLRGRSQRRWINHPDRLKNPLKRVEGTKRGEGQYEEISWDEAIDLFYEKLKGVIDTYGNEAVLRLSSLGSLDSADRGSWFDRLMSFQGGCLNTIGTDSSGQSDWGVGFMTWGFGFNGVSYFGGSPSLCMLDSDLIVLWGSSIATSQLRGNMTMTNLIRAREKGARVVHIDVRMGEEFSGHPDEWIPIRPGTDGALACALSYVLIDEGFADEEQIRRYVVGYDEESMPESAKGKHLSYKDYLMGTGYDSVAKTPEWAASITCVPAETIYELARAIGNAKAAYIAAGLGIQRRSNGENTSRTIVMLSVISGHWGLAGTSMGLKPMPGGGPGADAGGAKGSPLADFENPVKAIIPTCQRIAAIDHGHEMTALHDGVTGVEALSQDVKFVYAKGTACLANQNPDVNWSASVLEDESKAEFIVGSDFFLTSSMRYCDLILPELMPQERRMLCSISTDGSFFQSVFGMPVQEPPFGCRTEYEWITDLADRFGVKDEFTQGMTSDDIIDAKFAAIVESGTYPTLPSTFEEGLKEGLWTSDRIEVVPSFAAFRADPEAAPLTTPSGKIECYSESLAQIDATWELDDPRDMITPIPYYNPGVESYEDATEEYPLLVSSFKSKIRYHSKFNHVEVLEQSNRHTVWVNPADAEPRGIKSGDMVRVYSAHGEIHIEARVTPRVIPGALVMEEGKMREVDENGVDVGGCVNTLCSHHPSPLAKFNNVNSIVAQIEKL